MFKIMRRKRPIFCANSRFLMLIGLFIAISIKKKRINPPSRIGIGRRFKIARLILNARNFIQ